MSGIPTSHELARDARWLVQAVGTETGLVRIVEMDREAYRQASFLDDRMFQIERNRMPVPWDVIDQASRLMTRRDARWIFHVSHVGSTLLSRLLGEVPNVLSIREPRFLRDIVPASSSSRAKFLPNAQLLFSRTFAADEVAIVKTTSFVSEIASELVPPADAPCSCMWTRAVSSRPCLAANIPNRNYLTALLTGRSGWRSGALSSLRPGAMPTSLPLPGRVK